MLVWLNDGLYEESTVRLSVTDHGFTVGDGVFETVSCQDGVPFALTRHVARLQHSAALLGLPVPEASLVRTAIRETVTANPHHALTRVRVTYTSGPGEAGSVRGPGPRTLLVTLTPAEPWPETTEVALVDWPRNNRSPMCGAKSTSYAENAAALAIARAQGCSEALVANVDGELCEGTGSNVFVVVDGQALTPPLTSGCLPGITRELVLTWCSVREATLPPDVLYTAQEVFITSSTRDVHPVNAVGERRLDAPGPVTAEIRSTFARMRDADPDP
ncbi:MAG: aminotransferase class IV [Actinobacteria bacterium]|nr:aminotransferase class IV [Actinomycetota bacterium]